MCGNCSLIEPWLTAFDRCVSQGTVKAAKQALSQVDASRVRALGVSGQQHGMVVLDKQDKVLRPAKVS
jgi:xylulokinase